MRCYSRANLSPAFLSFLFLLIIPVLFLFPPSFPPPALHPPLPILPDAAAMEEMSSSAAGGVVQRHVSDVFRRKLSRSPLSHFPLSRASYELSPGIAARGRANRKRPVTRSRRDRNYARSFALVIKVRSARREKRGRPKFSALLLTRTIARDRRSRDTHARVFDPAR